MRRGRGHTGVAAGEDDSAYHIGHAGFLSTSRDVRGSCVISSGMESSQAARSGLVTPSAVA